ncbi:MAG: hypothetical protein QOH90_576, partial [Actinomycetota bacterium]|nr:hypothetical protein [Actinomycetota bacterium]
SVVVLLLSAVGCSSSPTPSSKEQADANGTRDKKDGKEKKNGKGGRKDKGGRVHKGSSGNDGATEENGDGSDGDKGSRHKNGTSDGGPGDSGNSNNSGGFDPSVGYAAKGDSDSDAEKHGDTPSYIEIVRASVRGIGEKVQLTLTLAGAVPTEMPDENTFYSVGFHFGRGGGDGPYVYADADGGGWAPGVNDSDSYPGEFSVSGTKITFNLPWSALGGAQRFKWYANNSWTHSGLVDTSYSFDEAPNFERASYP